MHRYLAICLLFFSVTCLVYGASLHNQFVDWDDHSLIVDNPIVSSITPYTIARAFTSYDPELYIPLTFLSYQTDHAWGGFDPFMYHVTNLVLHTLNALLVTWFLFLLLGNGWLCIALGMLFAVHPLNTEAVAWASARKDVLSTFFFLASLLAYLRAIDRDHPRLFIASLLLFVLGLLSKVMIVTLPILLVLLDAARGRTFTKEVWLQKVPFFFFACIFGFIGLFGKSQIFVASTFWQKVLMACKSTMFYLQKFFWPTKLSVLYPYTNRMTVWSTDFAVPLVLTILFLVAALWLWKHYRLISFGLFFYFITLLPTFINFAKGGSVYFASDRYAYVPMVGLLLALGALVQHHVQTATRQLRRKAIPCVIFVLLLASFLSFQQAKTWRDSFRLFEQVIAYYPQSNAAHNNIGMVYLDHARTDEAIASFERAIALKPDPRTSINLAAAKAQKGLYDEALEMFHQVIDADPPSAAEAYYGIGNVYQRQGKLLEAVAQYQRAITVDPSLTNAYNNLGGVYLQLEDWNAAIQAFEKTLELNPRFAAAAYNAAHAYTMVHQNERAETLFQRAIALNPGDADAPANLAQLLYAQQRIDEAAALLRQSLSIDQSNPTALDLLLRMKRDGYVR